MRSQHKYNQNDMKWHEINDMEAINCQFYFNYATGPQRSSADKPLSPSRENIARVLYTFWIEVNDVDVTIKIINILVRFEFTFYLYVPDSNTNYSKVINNFFSPICCRLLRGATLCTYTKH